jgi:hypothetical protein
MSKKCAGIPYFIGGLSFLGRYPADKHWKNKKKVNVYGLS